MSLIERCVYSLKNNIDPHWLSIQSVDSFDIKQRIVPALESSQKFKAPLGGMFFDCDHMPIGANYRLPFPIIAVEHSADNLFNLNDGSHIRDRVVLAFEMAEEDAVNSVLRDARAFPDKKLKREDLGFTTICMWLVGGFWRVYPVAVFMQYSHLDGIEITPGSIIPSRFIYMSNRTGDFHSPTPQNIANDTSDERRSILSLLSLLECSNVKTEIDNNTIIADRVNRKRVRSGKAELFQYRTIFIDGEKHKTVSDGNGLMNGVAWHYRRGHIRRLSGERRIWVRATTVGSKEVGIVEHEYTTKNT